MKIKFSDSYAALKIRDFRILIGARFLWTLSIQMQSVIIGWQVYDYTKSPFALGLTGLAEAIPALITSIFAGHIADKYKRKNIIILSVLLYFIAIIGLTILSFNLSKFLDKFGIMPLYAIIAITGISRNLLYPAFVALIGQIVPKELYTNSSAWNSLLWHTATISGPALGGIIYGFFGVIPSYLFIILCISVSLFLFVLLKNYPSVHDKTTETFKQSFKSGLKFVFSNQILYGAMALDMFAVLFGGAVALLPIFASDILNVGPQGLGLLRAAPAIGAVIMSFILTIYPPNKKSGKKLFLSIAGFGVCIILFAISKNFYFSFILLLLSGAFDNVSVVIRQTILQVCVDDELKGRVAAVNSIFIGSSNEIGAFESGLAASLMRVVPSVVFGGCMTLIVVLIAIRKVPILFRFEIDNFYKN